MLAVFSRFFPLALLFLLLSCSTNQLGVVRSIEAEKELGEQTIPDFLLVKGGVFNDAETQRYVESLVAKLSVNTSIPDEFNPIPIKVLNTGTPSAYALPGGSIYVSRGIIALANEEAELAGVIAHEIGHVIARHSAKSVAANERFILDVIQDQRDTLERAGTEERRIEILQNAIRSRRSEVAAFSKEQELEADRLAIQILTASGYGSSGFGGFLRRLDQWQLRRAEKMGVTRNELETLAENSGYPEISKRVAALGPLRDLPAAPETQARLMSVIDGLRFEDEFNGGFIRDAKYWQPEYRISFDVPPEFFPLHGEHFRLVSQKGGVLLRIDETVPGRFDRLVAGLQQGRSPFESAKTSTINGIPVIIGKTTARSKDEDLIGQVLFFNLGTHVASMTMLSNREDEPEAQPLFDQMTQSFRRITPEEVPEFRTYNAQRIVPGDSISELARMTEFDGDREAATRLLNGLNVGQSLMTGGWIKLVR